MKKLTLLLMTIFAMVIFTGCGAKDDATNKDEKAKTEQKAEKTDDTAKKDETAKAVEPKEPTEHDMCAFCNMKAYTKDEDMGQFTVQAVTADGKHLFFDDSGCILNMTRKDETVKYEAKWVRDYDTKEWIDADKAVVVKSDVATPMKYGYSFFKDEAAADKFIKDNADKHPMKSSWDEIDKVSKERFMKKMQKMKMNEDKKDENSDSNSDSHSH